MANTSHPYLPRGRSPGQLPEWLQQIVVRQAQKQRNIVLELFKHRPFEQLHVAILELRELRWLRIDHTRIHRKGTVAEHRHPCRQCSTVFRKSRRVPPIYVSFLRHKFKLSMFIMSVDRLDEVLRIGFPGWS